MEPSSQFNADPMQADKKLQQIIESEQVFIDQMGTMISNLSNSFPQIENKEEKLHRQKLEMKKKEEDYQKKIDVLQKQLEKAKETANFQGQKQRESEFLHQNSLGFILKSI